MSHNIKIYLLLVLSTILFCKKVEAQGELSVELSTGVMVNKLTKPVLNYHEYPAVSGFINGIDVSYSLRKKIRVGLELQVCDHSFFDWGIGRRYSSTSQITHDVNNTPAYFYSAYFSMIHSFRRLNIYYGASLGGLYAKYGGGNLVDPYIPQDAKERGLTAHLKLGLEIKLYRMLYFDLQYKIGREWVYENDRSASQYDLQGTYNSNMLMIGLKYYFLLDEYGDRGTRRYRRY